MCTKKELNFSVFLIHNLAEKWNKSPSEVYKLLDSTHILDDYIIGCYDTLHTLGKNYLMEDITEFAIEKGVAL
ncbi:MAG: DUF3791 domain-containing protein [Eubacteriales bacterium]|nr:DUF3791 domain-containing protein [Eubacteriales bacterium]